MNPRAHPMAVLAIRHVPESDPPRFQLERSGSKETEPVEIRSPTSFPVDGRANSGLVRERSGTAPPSLQHPAAIALTAASPSGVVLRSAAGDASNGLPPRASLPRRVGARSSSASSRRGASRLSILDTSRKSTSVLSSKTANTWSHVTSEKASLLVRSRGVVVGNARHVPALSM